MRVPPTRQVTDDRDFADVRKQAKRQAHLRIAGKFLCVIAVLGAYSLLRGLEAEKHSYDEEQSRQIVIVNDSDAEKKVAVEVKARLLKVNDVVNKFEANLPTGVENGFDEETVQGVKKTIHKVKYQNFPDEKELIARLEREIIAAADYEKKALLATQEFERKKEASKVPELIEEESSVKEQLKEQYRLDHNLSLEIEIRTAELDNWIKNKTKELNQKSATTEEIAFWRKTRSSLTTDQLLRWLGTINRLWLDDTRRKGIQQRIVTIDDGAQRQIRALYTGLRPKLRELLEGAVNAPQKRSSVAFLNPRAVFDQKSGSHVIYQTLWMTLVMVLVFGLLFVLIIALRFLPFVSRGTDQLVEHAGALLKYSGGAGASMAKSLVVTAGALGLGAAVVVGGNAVEPKSHISDTDDKGGSSLPQEPKRGPGGESGPRGPEGEPGTTVETTFAGIDLHEVRLLEPIFYPSPVTVSGPRTVTLDPDPFMKIVDRAIAGLGSRTSAPITGKELDDKIATAVKNHLEAKIGAINLPELSKDTKSLLELDLPTKIAVLESWRASLGSEFATNLAKDVAATKIAVEDLRNISIERQNSGGRSLLTRTKQALNSDKYLVTTHALKVLRSLMQRLPTECPRPPEGTKSLAEGKCCGDNPTNSAYCDVQVEAILMRLTKMVSSPPMNESTFMSTLRYREQGDQTNRHGDQVDQTIDKWKPVILRYARMAY